VIPQNFERTVQLNTVEFLNKMRSVISMANARTHKVRLQFEGNNLELSASDPDVGGDSREALSVTHNGEGSFSIGFDGRYISEIFSMCKSEETVMKMNNPIGACIIEPVGEGLNFSFLLMPTHLTDD
jgi:DNA polymerase-3 subunit beta